MFLSTISLCFKVLTKKEEIGGTLHRYRTTSQIIMSDDVCSQLHGANHDFHNRGERNVVITTRQLPDVQLKSLTVKHEVGSSSIVVEKHFDLDLTDMCNFVKYV